MIGSLRGTLLEKSPHRCTIDVGGVGYDVTISLTTLEALPAVGENISLAIHTYVREDILALYGFHSPHEKFLFLKLIGVSGVGPKMAMAILSGIPSTDLAETISREDAPRLIAIPGVGRKTAERIIVELKDTLLPFASNAAAFAAGGSSLYQEARSALTNLGYSPSVAENALKKIKGMGTMPITDIIKQALKELSHS